MTLLYKYILWPQSTGLRVQCQSRADGRNKCEPREVGSHLFSAEHWPGFAGAFQCMNVGMLLPNTIGDGSEFLVITACILGGTSLAGGVGSIIPGTLIGVVFYYSIENVWDYWGQMYTRTRSYEELSSTWQWLQIC